MEEIETAFSGRAVLLCSSITHPISVMATNEAHASVLTPSEAIPENAVHVKGPDFSKPIDLAGLLTAYETIGFQATGLGRAIEIVEEMVGPKLRYQLTISANKGKTRNSPLRFSSDTPRT